MSTVAVAHEVPHGVHPAPTSFWRKYIFSLDHKVIGKQYLFYALFMLVIGGLLAMLVRWQLAWPGKPIAFMGKLVPEGMPGGQMLPEFYNSLFTMHATIMIFFAIMPILIGAFGNFVVPIQIGARDMAFPTLNMLSFWTAVPAAVLIIWSFFVTGGAAQSGWTSLRAALGHPVAGPDVLAARAPRPGDLVAPDRGQLHHHDHQHARARHDVLPPAADGLGALHHGDPAAARAAGPLRRADHDALRPDARHDLLPAGRDHRLGAAWKNAGGGQPLLWQHLFWFFGHPEVYIMILPAMGIASEILPVFSRKPIFGYRAMAYSMAGIAGLGLHRLGPPHVPERHEPAARHDLHDLDDGDRRALGHQDVQLARHALGRQHPLHDADAERDLAFVAMFVIGGLSGIFMASTPVDIFIHDTYFIVGHIHYVLFGGSLFGAFAGHLLLVPEDVRPDDERDLGQGPLLADVHRVQLRLLPDAHPRDAGHAAAHLRLLAVHAPEGPPADEPVHDDLRSSCSARRRSSWS